MKWAVEIDDRRRAIIEVEAPSHELASQFAMKTNPPQGTKKTRTVKVIRQIDGPLIPGPPTIGRGGQRTYIVLHSPLGRLYTAEEVAAMKKLGPKYGKMTGDVFGVGCPMYQLEYDSSSLSYEAAVKRIPEIQRDVEALVVESKPAVPAAAPASKAAGDE